LAQTAARFGQRPSSLLQIRDTCAALDFDITCGYRLMLFDLERQRRELAALSGEDFNEQGQVINMGGRRALITKDTQYW
jgi:hypothetical protein